MSREIKFRGKRVDNSELVYGHYVKYEHMGVVKCFIVMNLAQIYVNSHEIDSETVGQFTGLTDKKGIEIYDGDIFKDWQGKLSIVRWNVYRWVFEDIGEKDFKYRDGFHGVGEVIGNIHQNADLLV